MTASDLVGPYLLDAEGTRWVDAPLTTAARIGAVCYLDEIPESCSQTLLEPSQEAVALLSIAIDGLGDPFAIAGFSSNTRHEVRYQHIKGFDEKWDDEVKSRLSAMEAGYSTRMGAAIRHAGHLPWASTIR